MHKRALVSTDDLTGNSRFIRTPGAGQGGEPPRPLTNRIPGGEIVLHPRCLGRGRVVEARPGRERPALVDRLKRRYNVDESRIYAHRHLRRRHRRLLLRDARATPWAACLPLNGIRGSWPIPTPAPTVSSTSATSSTAPCTSSTAAAIGCIRRRRSRRSSTCSRRAGVPLEFQVYPEAGHDVSWWPVERAGYEAFLAAHPRQPHPERISGRPSAPIATTGSAGW